MDMVVTHFTASGDHKMVNMSEEYYESLQTRIKEQSLLIESLHDQYTDLRAHFINFCRENNIKVY